MTKVRRPQYGGHIEANWESEGTAQRYRTMIARASQPYRRTRMENERSFALFKGCGGGSPRSAALAWTYDIEWELVLMTGSVFETPAPTADERIGLASGSFIDPTEVCGQLPI